MAFAVTHVSNIPDDLMSEHALRREISLRKWKIAVAFQNLKVQCSMLNLLFEQFIDRKLERQNHVVEPKSH